MKIVKTKISELKLAKYNPRVISDKELNNLKKSLKKFGFVQPVVANKNRTVIGGHQRIRAWKEMGNDSVPTVFVDVTPKEEKALNLAMNRISGEWDTDKLFEVISDIKTDKELEYTGFDEKEISRILDVNIEDEEEEEKPLEELLEIAPNRAKTGEIWQLGEHRVMCGDSTIQENIDKLLGEKKADMVFTDPPYNVDYESNSLGKIKNDKMSDDKFTDFIGKVFAVMHKSCKEGAVIYICSGWQSFSTFLQKLRENHFHISETIIWVKNQAGIRTIDFPHKHEQIIKAKRISKRKKKGKAIIYGWKKGEHKYYGDRSDYDVWEMDRLSQDEYLHPTEKPDWLVMKALKNSSKFKDIVLDLFGGSGSTIMACEKMGRRAFVMEMDKKFVDVIIYKWERLTKKKAKLVV